MSNRKWNTVKERQACDYLTDLCLEALLTDDSSDDDDDEDDEDDVLEDLLAATIELDESISRTLESTVDFTKPPLRVAALDEVQAVNDFRFRKEDLTHLIESLRLPLEKYLDFVPGTDQVRLRNRYSIPYETGVLMVLFRLARPQRVRSDIERTFCCRRSHCSAVCQTFIDAMYEVAYAYLSDITLLKHRWPLYADNVAAKT